MTIPEVSRSAADDAIDGDGTGMIGDGIPGTDQR